MTRSTIIESIIARGIPLLGDDIDTDRIIPARFLKEISFKNMGRYLFYDERFNSDGIKQPHALNDPRFIHGSILIVGRNFGCGSSREHAPQSIKRFGIQAIIGESFADIFSSNCKAIGIPVVTASHQDILSLITYIKRAPDTFITINIVSKRVSYFEECFLINMPDPQQHSFLKGTWNVLELLNEHVDDTHHTASQLPYLNGFNL